MHSKHFMLATSALLAATISVQAHAQTRTGATAAASNTIEELVVTAEKRSQNLQDVPVAISAFTSERRDLIGIKSIQDLTNFTPGLNYTSGNDRAAVRGIGRLTNAHPVAVPVAVYDDGIYTTSTTTAGKSPIFTDRIEVLRGPQGTLYGRNSLGGAINIISKRPTEDWYGEVRGTLANYNRTLFEAALSGPLAPGLQFRLAGNWEKQRDGWFTNVVPGMPSEGNVIDQYFVEAQLQAKFSDRLDGWAKIGISGWNNGSGGPGARNGYSPSPFGFGEFGAQNVNAGFACAPGGVVTNVVNTSPLGCVNPASQDPRKFATNIAQTVSLDESYTIATNLTYHFDDMDLKYVGGGGNYHYTLISDNGGGSISSFTIPTRPASAGPPAATCSAGAQAIGLCTPLTIFPRQASTYQEDYHNVSHELNLASTTKSNFQWLAGLYFYREGYEQPVFTTLFDQPQLDKAPSASGPAITGTLLPPSFQRRLYDDRPQFEEESYATYGQIDWKLTDNLKFTAGLRYNHDKLTGTERVRVICFATTACGTTPELLGSFTPPVDVTFSGAVVYLGKDPVTGAPLTPVGVVPNGQPGGVSFSPDGFASRNYAHTWTATTGTAGLEWNPDSETNVYGRYSRGYLMGGFNSGVTSTLGQFPFTDAEFSNDWEFGIKKEFGRRLQVNLAVFYNPIDGYQAPLTVSNNTGGLAVSQSRYVNIPKALTQGIELETIWIPVDNLQILFNYSFNDAKIRKLCGIIDPTDPLALQPGAKPLANDTVCPGTLALGSIDANTNQPQRPQDLAGNQLPQAPRNKIALNANYTFNFENGSLIPSINYIWRDKQYSGLFSRPFAAAPSWSQVDLRVTWKDRDNKYSIIGYVNNVFDDLGYDGGASASRTTGVYYQSTINAAGLTPGRASTPTCVANPQACIFSAVQGTGTSYALTPPRTYGVEFQYRF
jgi:iron complex outermembrane receptor protein